MSQRHLLNPFKCVCYNPRLLGHLSRTDAQLLHATKLRSHNDIDSTQDPENNENLDESDEDDEITANDACPDRRSNEHRHMLFSDHLC